MAESIRLQARNTEIYRQYVLRGRTQEDIAEEFGITRERVSQIISGVERDRGEKIGDRDALMRKSAELAADVLERALALADLDGAPLTAGKDGTVVLDPATGDVVRDFSGRMAALKLALAADEQLARRLGLNAPTRVETSGTVRYEIEGVDPEAMT